MRIAIVGCGLIGQKRAAALDSDDALLAAIDVSPDRARAVASRYPGCAAGTDWRDALKPEVEAVIVSTTNDMLVTVAGAALAAGKHILIEKPAARNARELQPLLDLQRRKKLVAKVGFNLRFHPALLRARQIVDSGALGPLMFVRARYGHGGRLGMESEWRGKKAVAGGGEMLDQGIHLVDLSRWFLGDFAFVAGHLARFFWQWEVEDNGFALLRTASGQVAWLHASCTEWKNLFSFELAGRVGKIQIDGIGGSYGPEKLTHYRMLPQMGPPQFSVEEFPAADTSWRAEYDHFKEAIANNRPVTGGLDDALAALRIIDRLYEQTDPASLTPPSGTNS